MPSPFLPNYLNETYVAPTAVVDTPLTVTTYLKFKHLLCEGPIEGLVQTTAGVRKTCGTTDGSAVVTCSDTSGIAANQTVRGNGIPVGAYVLSVSAGVSFTLDANAMLTGTSELEVGGSGALQSVFFNKTPLQNSDNSFNFKGWILLGTNGDLNQRPIEGFDGEEGSTPGIASSEVRYGETTHIATISNVDANAARLLIALPQLTTTDTKSGEIHGSTVNFAIDLKASGESNFTEVVRETVTGKSTSQYVKAVRINLDGTGPWQVRVRRITPDATDIYTQNKLYWQAMFEITDLRLNYPYSSVFAGQFDASQIEGIPEITYHLKLLRVQVPMNYDPITRVYATTGPGTTAGVWDGTFKTAWTDNPAWCFYDLLVNNRYGLGDYIDVSLVDKWTLYDIGQYCDVLVPDGQGGTEPRFTCNLFLQSREEAFKVVANFASVFRGVAWWATGKILFYQDRYRQPVFTFTQANVEEGMFTYTGTAKKARHSVAIVTWNDPNDFSERKYEYVEDTESIRLFGIRELELGGFGCASRGQARRIGLWALYSEREETEMVMFNAGFDALQSGVSPGSIINIADPARAGKRLGGRIVSVTDSVTVVLDSAFVFESGKSYTFYGIDPNGDQITRSITNPGTSASTITLATALTGGLFPAVNSVWAIGADDLALQQFRIVAIEETKNSLFKITALEYDSGKYALIEEGVDFDTTPITSLPPVNQVEAPSGVSLREEFSVVPEGIERRLFVSWTQVGNTSTYVSGYNAEYRYGNLDWRRIDGSTTSGVAFQVRYPGDYEVRVRSFNRYNRKSPWVYAKINLPDAIIANAAITGLELEGQGNDTDFVGKDPVFVWRYNSPDSFYDATTQGNKSPLLDAYVVKIFKLDDTLLRIEDCPIPRYVYTHDKNFEDTSGVPVRSFKIQVAARDKTQYLSNADELIVSNEAPLIGVPPAVSADLFRVTSQGGKVAFSYDAPNDIDFQGIMVFVKKGAGGFALTEVRANAGEAPLAAALIPYSRATDTGMLLYKGKDTYVAVDLDPTETYQFIFAPYDLFGLEGINYYGSLEYNVDHRIDTLAPVMPTGVSVTTKSEIGTDGSERVLLVLKFDPNDETDLMEYGLRLREITGTPTFTGPNLTGYSVAQLLEAVYSSTPARVDGGGFVVGTDGKVTVEFEVKSFTYYEVSVSAIDTSGNASTYTALTTSTVLQSAKDSTPPAAPTGVTIGSAIRAIFLTWTKATEKDLSHTAIYRNTTNTFPSGDPYAVEPGNSFVDTQVTIGQAYYYFLKSVDTSGNETVAPTASVNTTPGRVATSDVTDFAITLTKQYTATIALAADVWTNNSPTGTAIAWNAHTLYYQGVAYAIAAGNTTDGYVYWNPAVSTTVYQTSAANPALGDGMFMVATNVAGAHDLAWNALANALIGTAYIQNLAVTDAKIASLTVDKLLAGSINAQDIQLIGSAKLRSASATAEMTGSGFWIEGNGASSIFRIGDPAGNYLWWNGTTLEVVGDIFISNPTTAGINYAGAASPGAAATNIVNQGALATLNSADWSSQVAGATKPEDNATVGAAWASNLTGRPTELTDGRVATALNSSGTVVTRVVPGSAASPGSAGLYLGSDYMGYHNGTTWKTYMQNNGNFYLAGTSGNALAWDGTTLSVVGSITATTGTIGGFTIGTDYVRDVANTFGLASTVTAGDDVRFWAGDTFSNRNTAPFRLTESGALYASLLTAAGGTIGGFTIGADYIRDAANSFGIASTVTGGDDVRFWAGAAFASRATAPFRVTEAGNLVAVDADITGTIRSGSSFEPGVLPAANLGDAGSGGSISSATYAEISPVLRLTVTLDSQKHRVELVGAYIANASGAATTCYIAIYRSGNVIVELADGNGVVLDAGDSMPLELSGFDTPGAGSHTYELRVHATGATSVAGGGTLSVT